MSNRPDWCPEDVWEEAFEIYDPAALAIARAIMAERERCAAVVESRGARYNPGWIKVILEATAKAIRDPQV